MRILRVLSLGLAMSLTSVSSASPAAPSSSGLFAGLLRREHVSATIHQRAVGLAAVRRTPMPRPRNATIAAGTVEGVQQISRDALPPIGGAEPDTEQEPMIAVDPNNPEVVVAVFQEGRYPDIAAVDDGYATSHDGGRTWIHGDLPNLTQAVGGPYERASDPVVAFGPDGAVYATTIAMNQVTDFRTAVTVQRSDDGGLTFGDPVIVREDANPLAFNDKEWIAVDTYPSSPHFGRIYVVWDRIFGSVQPPVISFSDDRGATWSRVRRLSTVANALGTYPLVQPNGDLTVVYLDVFRFSFVAQTSHDGGATFGPLVVIDDCMATDPPDQRDGGCIPGATVDPVTGFLYAGWTDARFRADGLDDAVVSRSTDGGVHWSAPIVVNPDVSGSQLEHMTTALGAYGHTVHVAYFTRWKTGTSTFGRYVRERYSVSNDDGATFGGELLIGPRIDLKWSADAGGFHFLGDYMGVAASPTGEAHPVWCRSSEPPGTGAYHQTTWTATVLS